MTKEEFINEARRIHGKKYEYLHLDDEIKETNMAIHCPRHGLFYQTPYMHLHTCGCFECYKDEHWDKRLR